MNRLRHALTIGTFVVVLAVPVRTEEAPTSAPLRLAIDLVDGSRVIGIPAIAAVPVQTVYAKMSIPLGQVHGIEMADDHETAAVDLQNGDKIKGVINLGPVPLTTLLGKVTVGIEHIRALRVLLSGGASARKGLVFWNKLGSEKEVLNSEVGPGLKPYTGGGWPEVAGIREYVPGKHGAAVTIKGAYQNMSRVYNLDGKKVAAARENDWGTNAKGRADIAGGMDGNCAGKFLVDNLKIWSYAKTDFSDRNEE